MPNHASLISPNGYNENGRLKSGWATADNGAVSREQMAQMSPEDRRAMIESFTVSLQVSYS
jgi:surface antigen